MVISSISRPTSYVAPQKSSPNARSGENSAAGFRSGASTPGLRATRMRWTPARSDTHSVGTRFQWPPQGSATAKRLSAAQSPAVSVSPGGMLATFEQLQRRLESYDNRDLADFGSVLRVADRKAVLSTEELMRLPAKLHQARMSVARIIGSIKSRGQMPAHSLDFAAIHAKITALLDTLKRINPLPQPRAVEADAAGNLLRAGANPASDTPSALSQSQSQSLSQPQTTTPVYGRTSSFTKTSRTPPHERAYIASLRAPVATTGGRPKGITLGSPEALKADMSRQREEIGRAQKLWSSSMHEKSDMAGAIGSVADALRDCVDENHGLMTTKNLEAVAKVLSRLVPLKKNVKGLTLWIPPRPPENAVSKGATKTYARAICSTASVSKKFALPRWR